nr:MAG TPA: hypothetical protein [Caudoviricetes sp.]DAG43255.1 MAG TPA: hypothetical protein [Bacteriophage sp.]
MWLTIMQIQPNQNQVYFGKTGCPSGHPSLYRV